MNRKVAKWLRVGVLAALPVTAWAGETISSAAIASSSAVSNVEYGAAGRAVQRAAAQAAMATFSSWGLAHIATFSDDDPFFQNQSKQNDQQQARPPTNNQGPPSVGDLGFPTEQTKPNPQEQARLDKRSRMLKIHQRLGLITTVPLVATVITGGMAGGRQTSSTNRDLHAALGSLTAGLYFTTAYYSIFAPKIQGTPTRGPIRLHKALAWIHGPGMILTPVLGEMAFAQKNRGERVHGIAKAHGAVAIVTAGAYGLAILGVSIKF